MFDHYVMPQAKTMTDTVIQRILSHHYYENHSSQGSLISFKLMFIKDTFLPLYFSKIHKKDYFVHNLFCYG